jgi:DNA-3-methyladenine glycosylase I
MKNRLPCGWAPVDDELYRSYHDTEWGVPEYDSRALWEKLQLDGMQAGLAWITILRKRHSIREEFDSFDPESIAAWNENRIDKAMKNSGIIRSRQKINAVIGNAKTFLAMAEQGENFSDFCWGWVNGSPIVNEKSNEYRKLPTKTSVSESFSKDLKKRGFKYVGPTIVYAWMQAVGLVNDHEVDCPRHAAVKKLTA